MGGGGGGCYVTGVVSLDEQITEDVRMVDKCAGHVRDSVLIAEDHPHQSNWIRGDYWELRKALDRLGQSISNWERRRSRLKEDGK